MQNPIEHARFDHAGHVKAAFTLLRDKPFLEAAEIYCEDIRKRAGEAGHPEKFNLTITLAFLSLIAEHIADDPDTDWESFIARNPVLLDKTLLTRWYTADRLWSDAARRTFLMPEAAI